MDPKERGILYSGPMVRAKLAREKDMTRRLLKPQPAPTTLCGEKIGGLWLGKGKTAYRVDYPQAKNIAEACPYGQPGDRLWMRETWAPVDYLVGSELEEPVCVAYQADRTALSFAGPKPRKLDTYAWPWDAIRWKPSIHQFRWASRILDEVTAVRIERVQSITDADAEREGMLHWARSDEVQGLCRALGVAAPTRPRFIFEMLWQRINGIESWKANPFVWVVETRPLEVRPC